MTRLSLIALAFAALTAVPFAAHADDRSDAVDRLYDYLNAIVDMKHSPMNGPDARLPIGGCDEAVAKARAAGVADDFSVREDLKFGAMPGKCKEFVEWHRIAEAAKVLLDSDDMNYWLTEIDIAENDEKNQEGLVAQSAKCTSEMDRLLAEGLKTDITIDTRIAHKITLAEGKEKICAPLAKAAKTFAKSVTKARDEKLAAATAPYKKVGITGDRLQVCIQWHGYMLRGVGGRELASPRDRKTPSLMFATLGPASDTGLYTIRRFAFRGDKLISVTEQQFLRMPGAAGYR